MPNCKTEAWAKQRPASLLPNRLLTAGCFLLFWNKKPVEKPL
jgi:hypothetical protein